MPPDRDGDTLMQLADKLREKKGVAWAAGKWELDERVGLKHIEFFRGKDFARYFQAKPELLEQHVPAKLGRSVDDQIGDLMQQFLKRRIVRKADRKYKKPKPGRKRLVKFPKTLEPVQEPGWTESAFYVWQYDRPTSVWHYVGTVAIPILVILACLFPLAPWWMRMGLVYVLMTILGVLLGLIAVRYVLFAIVWILTGHAFWLFPNLMSDEVAIWDALRPLIKYDKPKASSKSQLLARGLACLLAAGFVYMLYSHTPDADALKDRAKRAHDSILDYLDVYGKGKTFLEGNTTANATSNSSSSSGAGAGADGGKSGPRGPGQAGRGAGGRGAGTRPPAGDSM